MNSGPAELDRAVRLAAFRFLQTQQSLYGEVVPWRVLSKEFFFDGKRVPLIGAQGIFKPKILPDMPISIATAPEIPGKPRPYDDEPIEDGRFIYKYRGFDPLHRDNVGLQKAMLSGVPLIYFYGVEKGWYRPAWPAFVVGDFPEKLSFQVALDDPASAFDDALWTVSIESEPRRRYITAQTQQRLHQTAFRSNVLRAYYRSCAICRLKHPELLDAAHIIPDSNSRGIPVVSNGISLCAIHHKAFDRNIIGIRPDYKVDVRRDILEEIDGPMLKYGLQDCQGKPILLPRRESEKPNLENLEYRYERFLKAG